MRLEFRKQDICFLRAKAGVFYTQLIILHGITQIVCKPSF